MQGKPPVKLVLWYVTKTHVKTLPFEFKDIGLPRKEGKFNAEKMEF